MNFHESSIRTSGNLLPKGATKALATIKAAQLKATLDAKLAMIQP